MQTKILAELKHGPRDTNETERRGRPNGELLQGNYVKQIIETVVFGILYGFIRYLDNLREE